MMKPGTSRLARALGITGISALTSGARLRPLIRIAIQFVFGIVHPTIDCRLTAKVCALSVLSCWVLAAGGALAGNGPSDTCRHDDGKTLAVLEEHASREGNTFADVGVPADFRIERRSYAYVVIEPTEVRNLPTGTVPGTFNYMPPHHGMAICRVTGPDGKRWYVERMPPNGTLVYVDGDDISLESSSRKDRGR